MKMAYFKGRPLRGVNEIEFGMSASQVRSMVAETPEQFRRHDEIFASDHFVQSGIFGYYDPDGHLEAHDAAAKVNK